MDSPLPRATAHSAETSAKVAVAQPIQTRPALPPLDQAFQALLLPVRKALARIEARLEATAGPATPAQIQAETKTVSTPAPSAVLATEAAIVDDRPLEIFHQRFDQLSEELTDFRREATALMQLNAIAAPPSDQNVAAPEPPPTVTDSPRGSGAEIGIGWEEIILGSELCDDPSLHAVRRQFLDDVVSGGVSARALAGQLLLLQATAIDELPERFRHVGEAYYRWQPRLSATEDLFERSLADFLTHRAEAAGLRNSIELVRLGDRFDSSRHAATTRGVEVAGVHGWIVLRDNQKVYTKASVTVR